MVEKWLFLLRRVGWFYSRDDILENIKLEYCSKNYVWKFKKLGFYYFIVYEYFVVGRGFCYCLRVGIVVGLWVLFWNIVFMVGSC